MSGLDKHEGEAGPASYRNWRAKNDGGPYFGSYEVPLYSDAHVTGDVLQGLGPHILRNGLPAELGDPAVVLVLDSHLDANQLPPMDKTDTASFTGSWLGDEIAALLSLACGARFMAGAPTRIRSDATTWRIMGDTDRPVFFPSRKDRSRVLPRVVATTELRADPLASLPSLAPSDAMALIRAARSYRDGLWIAEVEPELSWLLFVSALEVAAVHQQINLTEPIDILRASKPKLVERLESVDPSLAQEVAASLARELRATARFLDFMERFMPAPPSKRPPFPMFQVDWSPKALKRSMKTIYELRSNALHEGVPFPPPMCLGPRVLGHDWEAPVESMVSSAMSTGGGVWTKEDAPFPLHTFEYMTRGALLGWWKALAETERPEAPPSV